MILLAIPAPVALGVPADDEIEQIDKNIEEKEARSSTAKEDLGALREKLEEFVTEYQDAYARLQAVDKAVAKRQRELDGIIEQQMFYQGILDELSVFTYRDGDTFFLEVILGTSSFNDLLTRLNYLIMLSQRQAEILEATKDLKRRIKIQRDELEEEKTHQQRLLRTIQEKQENITLLLQQQQELINSLDEDISQLAVEKTKQEKERDRQIEAERARLAQLNQGGSNVIIDIVFPIPGAYASSYINDWGFPRAGNPSGHQGCDIFAIKGTPVIACADGVISDEFGDSRIGGYRLHVIDDQGVDHYYAHLNNDSPGTDDGLGGAGTAYANGIGPGVRVKAGQVVGYVGDSGDAETTPSHLHFGIRVNNEWIPPYPHLQAAEYR